MGSIINNGTPTDFTRNVTGLSPSAVTTTHGVTSVCVNMTHNNDDDMEVYLIAPDGTEVLLFSGVGGSGNNFTNTCLNPSAAALIINGNAPFSGSYKPMGYLGNVNNNQNGNQAWKLRCIDTNPMNQGTLNSWSITFGNNAQGPLPFDHSNLPIVIINTNNIYIPDEPKIPATMKIIYNGPTQTTYINDPPNVYSGNIGIELRGNYSVRLPQRPYTFETRDANGLESDVSLLGMPSEHDWLLIANYNDKAFVRNTLSYKLFTEMGHYAPRSSFCEVILNGQYKGIYLLMEKVKRDKNRVDIAKLDYNDNAGDSLTGGYIIMNDPWTMTNSWRSNFHPIDHQNLNVNFVYEYRSSDSITSQQKNYIQTFFNDLETALYSSNFADPVSGYRKYMSIISFLDYFLINELSRNVDGFKKSVFYHKDKDKIAMPISKLKMGPVWDFDWAWKNIMDCSTFQATDGSGWSHRINDCPNLDVKSTGWYVRLLQDPIFASELKCRWTNLRKNILDTTYIFNYIDSVEMVLDTAQKRHYNKWGHLGQNSGAPEMGSVPTTFTGEVAALKSWIRKRIVWLDANMPGSLVGCSITGVKEVGESLNSVFIYPNPSSGIFTVERMTGQVQAIEVLDVIGKKVFSKNAIDQMEVIDLSHQPKGIYLVKVSDDKGYLSLRKILIQ